MKLNWEEFGEPFGTVFKSIGTGNEEMSWGEDHIYLMRDISWPFFRCCCHFTTSD